MELLHILNTAVNAVVPIVLLMALGYILRVTGFFTEDFVNTGMKLVFNCLLPASLFETAYQIESFTAIPWDIVIFSLSMLVVLYLLGRCFVPWITKDPTKRGPLLQAIFRSNSAIIGIPLAQVLGGGMAISVATIVVAFSLPMLNILAVLALTVYMGENGKKADPKDILIKIATNPLIIGTMLGLACLGVRTWEVSRFGRAVFTLKEGTPFLYAAVSKAGSVASPFALIMLGGQFQFSAAGDLKKEIAAGVLWRCLLAPGLVLFLAWLLDAATPFLHCGTEEYPSLMVLFGTPVAVSSAVMAGQMGGHKQLATQLVVWSSVVSIFGMFLMVCVLMGTGLLAI